MTGRNMTLRVAVSLAFLSAASHSLAANGPTARSVAGQGQHTSELSLLRSSSVIASESLASKRRLTYALVGAAIGGGVVILGGLIRALSAGAANDPSAKFKGSPLHDTAASGNEDQIRSALEAASDVNVANEFGFTPLNVAAWRANTDAVARLLEAGADVSARDRANATALHHAFLGHDERREERGAHPTSAGGDGANSDLVELEAIVQHLVDAGIDVNAVSPLGSTPLHGAAVVGSGRLIRTLIGNGADINAAGEIECTPLAMAVAQSNVSAVALLLELGADMHGPMPVGSSTLLECAKQFGADSEIVNVIEDRMARR